MRRPLYYRKDGTPIYNTLEWARLMEDWNYRRVAETHLEDGTRISTVWLGIDHRFFGEGPPIIFETMVFSPVAEESLILRGRFVYEDWDQVRYSTEAEAIAGHEAAVAKWRAERANVPPSETFIRVKANKGTHHN